MSASLWLWVKQEEQPARPVSVPPLYPRWTFCTLLLGRGHGGGGTKAARLKLEEQPSWLVSVAPLYSSG